LAGYQASFIEGGLQRDSDGFKAKPLFES